MDCERPQPKGIDLTTLETIYSDDDQNHHHLYWHEDDEHPRPEEERRLFGENQAVTFPEMCIAVAKTNPFQHSEEALVHHWRSLPKLSSSTLGAHDGASHRDRAIPSTSHSFNRNHRVANQLSLEENSLFWRSQKKHATTSQDFRLRHQQQEHQDSIQHLKSIMRASKVALPVNRFEKKMHASFKIRDSLLDFRRLGTTSREQGPEDLHVLGDPIPDPVPSRTEPTLAVGSQKTEAMQTLAEATPTGSHRKEAGSMARRSSGRSVKFADEEAPLKHASKAVYQPHKSIAAEHHPWIADAMQQGRNTVFTMRQSRRGI